MKYLIVLLLVGLSACDTGPRFKRGDCIAEADLEKWEKKDVHQIIEVGKRNYLYRYKYYDNVYTHDWFIWSVDERYEKVDCPCYFTE